MDIFQFIGDFLHLIAVLMLLLKIVANKNVIGNPYTTQVFPTGPNNFSLLSSSRGISTFSLAGKHSMSLLWRSSSSRWQLTQFISWKYLCHNLVQETVLPESWSWSRCFSSLLSLRRSSNRSNNSPQISQSNRFPMVFQHLVVISSNIASTLYDKQTARYIKHHSSLRSISWHVQRVLHSPLVLI